MVSQNDLRSIAGARSVTPMMGKIADAFNQYADQYGINNQRRISQFLANVCHETGGFSTLTESLNYSVDGLLNGFGRHRISEADARRLGRTNSRAADQRTIANILYGGDFGRKNLGNILPDDGWNFRGSGPGQITGRVNFEKLQAETGIQVVANPDLMRDANVGMQAALICWQAWGLNEKADAGLTDAIRKRWNGGTKGLTEVRQAYARAMNLSLDVPQQKQPSPTPTPEPPPRVLPVDVPAVEAPIAASGKKTATTATVVSVIAASTAAAATWWQDLTYWLGSLFQ